MLLWLFGRADSLNVVQQAVRIVGEGVGGRKKSEFNFIVPYISELARPRGMDTIGASVFIKFN